MSSIHLTSASIRRDGLLMQPKASSQLPVSKPLQQVRSRASRGRASPTGERADYRNLYGGERLLIGRAVVSGNSLFDAVELDHAAGSEMERWKPIEVSLGHVHLMHRRRPSSGYRPTAFDDDRARRQC